MTRVKHPSAARGDRYTLEREIGAAGMATVTWRYFGTASSKRTSRPACVNNWVSGYFHSADRDVFRHPRLLRALEGFDTICERPLALLGDHVLYPIKPTHDSRLVS
jgi:hypothetical protein